MKIDPALQSLIGWLETFDYRGRDEGTNRLDALVDNNVQIRPPCHSDRSYSTDSQVASKRPRDSFNSPKVRTVAVLDLDGNGVPLKRFHISFDEGEDLVETLFVPGHSLAKETFKIDERELYAWRL